jgi:hypothetical protein
MRVEFLVFADGQGWSIRRGSTSKLSYVDRERAITAAENLARSAAASGNAAVVRVADEGSVREHRSFAPERFKRSAGGPI